MHSAHDVVDMMHLGVKWNLSNAISTLQILSKTLTKAFLSLKIVDVVSACVVNQESEIVVDRW